MPMVIVVVRIRMLIQLAIDALWNIQLEKMVFRYVKQINKINEINLFKIFKIIKFFFLQLFQPIGEGIPKVTLPTPPPPGYEPLPEYNPPEYQSESEPQPRPPPRSYQYQTEPQYVRQSIYQPQTTPAPQPIYRPRYQNQYEVAEYQSQHVPRPVARQQRILASYNSPQPPPSPSPPSSSVAAARPRYQLEPHYQAEAQYGPHIEYSFNTPSQAVYREYQPEYNDITTPSPHRYYPPGKLDFTRTPDGFSYTFTKS